MTRHSIEVDARGLNCPLPILRLRSAVKAAKPGAAIRLLSTDPGSQCDVEAFCRQTGLQLVASAEQGGTYSYTIQSN